MKKTLKVLAVVCAGVLVITALMGIGFVSHLSRAPQLRNVTVQLRDVAAHELEREYSSGSFSGLFHLSEEPPDDYIVFTVRADLRRVTEDAYILKRVRPPDERTIPATSDRIISTHTHPATYLGFAPEQAHLVTVVLYVGGLSESEMEDYIHGLWFWADFNNAAWRRIFGRGYAFSVQHSVDIPLADAAFH